MEITVQIYLLIVLARFFCCTSSLDEHMKMIRKPVISSTTVLHGMATNHNISSISLTDTCTINGRQYQDRVAAEPINVIVDSLRCESSTKMCHQTIRWTQPEPHGKC